MKATVAMDQSYSAPTKWRGAGKNIRTSQGLKGSRLLLIYHALSLISLLIYILHEILAIELVKAGLTGPEQVSTSAFFVPMQKKCILCNICSYLKWYKY